MTQLWFTKHPVDVLEQLGIPTDRRRALEFENLIDGNLSGYYYIAMASVPGSDEALKWIMSSLATHLNEEKLPFSAVNRVLPADYLKTFVSYLLDGKFEKGFAKDIFAALLKADGFVENDEGPTRRLTGPEILDKIIVDPKFKSVDSSEIDTIIDNILSANPDQVAKIALQPQLVQWFVGQVMKAARGKATGAVVQEKLKAKLGV